MGHTPGPWFVNDDCIEAGGPEGPRDVTVAMVTGSTNPREANARLLAAAPELLRTCSSLLTMLEDVYEDDLYRHGSPSEDAWPTMLADARTLIAKAEGRTNED